MDKCILSPGKNIKPELSPEQCKELIWKLYGFECSEITELVGYDDKNFKVKKRNSGEQYVLKVMNSLDSKNLEFVDGQTKLSLFLAEHNVVCTNPIQNVNGDYFSVEKLASGLHVLRLMIYLEGSLFNRSPVNNKSLYAVGESLAEINTILEKFHHPVYETHTSIWKLDSVPQLRRFLYALNNPHRIQMIDETIKEFERRVLEISHTLPQGIIHGDFNDQNILVKHNADGQARISGVLDFGDTSKCPYMYEIAICLTYLLMLGDDLRIGGHVLAGYAKTRSFSKHEFSLLKICIMARLSQSLVMSAYTSLQDPKNEYLLTTSVPGWKLFDDLRDISDDVLLSSWRCVLREYGISLS